jgi:SulP family sulfate permease
MNKLVRRDPSLPGLSFFPPSRWLPKVNRQIAQADFMAGLTGAVVVLPQGVAFATIAGMPPEYGLYAGIVPAIIAAVFGSSWHLVSGPTTAASIVLFSSLSALAEPGSAKYVQLALTLTFMVGVIQLTMGLFRMGTLVNFISHSVVIGFTAGAAVLIFSNQVKNYFGLPIPRGSDFLEVMEFFFTHLGDINWAVTTVATITLLSGLLTKKFLPKVPFMIVAMLAGTGSAFIANHIGFQVKTIGALPSSLPPLSMPSLSLASFRELMPAAIAMTLFALTEAVSIARALAVRSGQHVNGNQEFVGQGLSNIVGSFFSAYVATGSFNRSGVNYQAGARTPLASIFAGLLLAAVVLLVAPYAAYLPTAAMGGILFLVAWGLIDFHHIHQIIKTSRAETAILSVTLFGAVFFELELAIFAGVMLSLGLYLNRTSHPGIYSVVPDPSQSRRQLSTDPELPECPQARLVRIDGSLFFGAVPYVSERLSAMNPRQQHLVLMAQGINFIDIAGAEALAQEAERRRKMGGSLMLINVKEGVCAPLRKGGYIDTIGETNIFTSKTQAMASLVQRMDPERCKTCKSRIFRECSAAGAVDPTKLATAAAE